MDVQREERAAAIAKVRAMMSEFGLTAADISGRTPTARAGGAAKPAGKVAVKYRNAATGETWTGRGLQPKWLKAALAGGAKIEEFSV